MVVVGNNPLLEELWHMLCGPNEDCFAGIFRTLAAKDHDSLVRP